MAQFEQHFVQDLTQPIKIRHCGTIVFNADDESNVISVRLFNGSEPVAISGSVVGAVVCSDGATVPLTGSYSGNTASITLTGDCFVVLGQIGVGIQIVNGTQKTTVLKAIYNVEIFTTENVVDPGSRITLEVGDLIDDIETAVASIPADYSDLLAAIAPNYSGLTFPVKAGTFCWYNGALYQAQQDITTSEAWMAAHWASAVLTTSLDEKLADVDDEIGDLKSILNSTPELKESETTGVDLDVSDPNGKVILRLRNGNISTKNFESLMASETRMNSETDADLDISDTNGNVIVRFRDGNLQTKKFNSNGVVAPIETYSKGIIFSPGTSATITINHNFKKGQEIYFHIADGTAYNDWGTTVSYYQGNTNVLQGHRGSNGYVRHVITNDCSSVGVSIASDAYSVQTSVTLYVYVINGEVVPKIVTVKSDGTGMFSTLKAAVDSITDSNHLTNPYIIEVYPGTYDTLEGFTDEEIASAATTPHVESVMSGLKILDGMYVKGVGNRDDIILTADLDPGTWSYDVRRFISTLNMTGESGLENLTIVGKNIRYCVHDDFRAPIDSLDTRILKRLKFKGENLAYAPLFTAYGAGMTYSRNYIIDDCDFGYTLLIHGSASNSYPATIIVNNCSGHRIVFGDQAAIEGRAVHHAYINNCNFRTIEITHTDTNISSHFVAEGVGCKDSMIMDLDAVPYRFGMVDLAPSGVVAGTMVKYKSTGGFGVEATNDRSIACGIVIGKDSDFSYVQKEGYIPSNYIGLTSLSIGDYITTDASGTLVSGGTSSNAVGVVVAIDTNSNAQIKMMI